MITKPTIIVTSIGRTGTLFFSKLFYDIILDATVLHEPDYINFFQYNGFNSKLSNLLKQINESSFYYLIYKKLLLNWDLIEISDDRLKGKIDPYRAINSLINLRKNFIYTRYGSCYVESSSAYYGLIDIAQYAFKHHRIVYIIRDGRDWVQSKMNWGQMYAKGRLRSKLAHTWPRSDEMKYDFYKFKWNKMSRFERICWAWTTLNTYAINQINENPYARLFYFEDIFKSSNRTDNLSDLINFATDLPSIRTIPSSPLSRWLERKIHKSEPQFPPWEDWGVTLKQTFNNICGPLMTNLGYY